MNSKKWVGVEGAATAVPACGETLVEAMADDERVLCTTPKT
ncbi:hypothetical protein [Allocoleopsis sp.]